MRKRKGRKGEQEPQQIPAPDDGEKGKEWGFFACYLLASLSPRFKGHTYIGYTVNPRRRIRQHNGEIGSGAWRTKKKRPWEMVLCIYDFPTNIAALQFEWAWQHPVESLAVRKAAASFKSLSGLANKIKLAYTMLTLPPWQSLNLTLNLFSTKYQQYTSSCPALPQQMQARVGYMDELPCYNENACINDEWDGIECDEGSSQEFRDRESRGGVREEVHTYIPEENFNHQINDVNFESSGHWDEFQASNIAEKTESPGLVDLSDEPLNKRTAVEYQPLIISPGEVEIIDTFTPSPCLGKADSKNKKRRRQTKMWPELIDLTNSPIYV